MGSITLKAHMKNFQNQKTQRFRHFLNELVMANHTINYFKLGLFVTIGLALFTATVYYIGNKQHLFGDSITLGAVFRNVNGLQSGNNVRYSGINVGTVSDISIVNDTSVQVEMTIEAYTRNYIRRDAIATISTDGLVGNMMVSIIPTKNAMPLIEAGDIIQSYSRIEAGDMLNTLNVTNENAAMLTADLLKITQDILEKKGTFGTLLYDTDLASDLKITLHNLRVSSAYISRASENLKVTTDGLENPDVLLYKLSNDTTLSTSIDMTMYNLKKSSEEITNATQQLNELISDIKTEEGAFQTIVYDTALANNLRQSMENISQGTERFNENMAALKSNFLTRKYFKKKAKEKKGN